MGITVSGEVCVFAASFLFGAAGGVLFDAFRALRRRVKSGTALVALEDILFWLLLSGLVFAFLYRVNNGQPRLFIFAGIALGSVLYLLTVSRYVIFLLSGIFGFFCKIFGFLRKIIMLPLRILAVLLSKINKKAGKILCKLKNDLKKIKKVAKMY